MRKLLMVWALVLVLASAAAAGELAGVELPDRVEAGGEELALSGMALRKVAIVKVYVAGLYLPAGGGRSGEAVLAADAPRHAVNHYLREAGRERLCEGWTDGLAANTPGASPAVRQEFDALCEWMGDVQKGDRFTFTYLPGEGTTLKRNGGNAKTVPGKEFADALFACWIGPDPGPGEKFKQSLLGG